MIPVSVIVLTLNEAANIAECLENLERFAEVIVVDSGSSDETIAIARQTRADVRVFEHPFEDFGAQRNWALDETNAKHDWVLFVDADEFCDEAFLDEVSGFLDAPGSHVGGFVAGRNVFLGRWLKHAMLYPSYQLRLVKRGEVRFIKHGHGQREVTDGPLHYFKNGWRHEGFSKGIADWIARHNRYSDTEVGLLADLARKPLPWRDLFRLSNPNRGRTLKHFSAIMPMRPVFTFMYLYVVKLGFLDGRPGLIYCLLMASHHVHIMAKTAEAAHRRPLSHEVGRT